MRESYSLRQFWTDLRSSVVGGQQDFTELSLGRSIFLLAVPMVLEMSMQALFGVVDIFFVARLGADPLATVAITEGLLTLIFAIALGLSMGATAVVARRTGEHRPDAAAEAAGQAILLGVALATIMGLFGLLFSPWLLAVMGGSPAVIVEGTIYTRVMLGANITVLLLFLINAIFRGVGDAAVAMRALWIANGLNIVLDPIFIFGWGPVPAMGVTGAAVATNFGRAVGIAYQIWILLTPRGRIQVTVRHFKPNLRVMWNLIRISLGGVLQFLVGTASWMGLIRIMALFGSSALAGYLIAIRILIFALLPSWGMGNAAATLVGQNLGAQQPDRAERSVWVTAFANMIFLGLIAVIFILWAEPICRIFTQDEAILSSATACLRIVSYGYVFYAWGFVVVQAFNGAGDTYTPTWINFICHWLIQIPLAYGLARYFEIGENGVFFAIAIAQSILSLVAVLVFRRGTWKEQQV